MKILTDSISFVRTNQDEWRQQMKLAVRTVAGLANRLAIPQEAISNEHAEGEFPLFVPEPYLNRIEIGNVEDPLLKQVLPIESESDEFDGYSLDPLSESSYTQPGGMIQKYGNRALLMASGVCAIHCRYCFRRHFPYGENVDRSNRWLAAIDQLRSNPEIDEVILSGGDPLTIVDEHLTELVAKIEEISHIRRLRLHTRLPIVIPARITARFLEILRNSRLETVVVLHSNHANEIDAEVESVSSQISQVCHALLNQSVLLRGINDDLNSLCELSERLFASRVLPYYLHQMDPVAGAAHFEVAIERGVELIQQMREQVSGFLVPRYVQEIPGQPNKVVLA